ncbi:PLP-dependent transferase [Coprothermobacter platensis]|uniref:PLP-dependent transferase n=1 Tax=Coprothermobacter platensis TaxID=108819 RepID=UPI000373A357|nr:PLP-dependent transferase [Coprothermobacter platensis]
MSKPLKLPIYRSTNFTFHDFNDMQAALYGDSKDYFYARDGHPTVENLEKKLLSFEPADFSFVFASGMAAISAGLLSVLGEGDHVIVQEEVYGPTRLLFEEYFPSFGVTSSFVDVTNLTAVEKAIKAETELVYVETPSPFTNKLCNLEGLRKMADNYELTIMADNSAGFGFLQASRFADLVAVSLSKYPAGDSQILGGALFGNEMWREPVEMERSTFGGVMMPWDAKHLYDELMEMPERLSHIAHNAYNLQELLKVDERVKNVYYPVMDSSKPSPVGGFVTAEFDMSLSDLPMFVDKLELFKKGVFWGGTTPVVTPLLASYRVDVLKSWGLSPNLVRFYTGDVNAEELYQDISKALS